MTMVEKYPVALPLPSVTEFITKMAQTKLAILAQAHEKEVNLRQAKKAVKYSQHAGFNPQKISLSTDERYNYHVKNLQIDYQFSVHKLRQDMGLDLPHFAYKAKMSVERLEAIEAGEVLPTIEELINLSMVSGRFIHLRFD